MIRGLILAGGLRRRLLPLMINTPLPLLPVGNFPLILFQLQQFKRAGITEVILSLAHQPRAIESLLGDGHNFGLTIRYMVESRPVGTGGAIRRARDLLDDTLVVLNGDVVTEASIDALLNEHRRHHSVLTLTTRSVDNPSSYGVVEANRLGRVTGFREQPKGESPRSNLINAGLYALELRALDFLSPGDQPQSLELDLLPGLLAKNAVVRARSTAAYWSEITRPNRYLRTNLDLLDGLLSPPRFKAFQAEQSPLDNAQASRSLIDASCTIKSGIRIENSVIGPNCRIEDQVQIRGSVIWPGCRIEESAFLSGTIVGRGTIIGAGARLRRGTVLGDKSVVSRYSRC